MREALVQSDMVLPVDVAEARQSLMGTAGILVEKEHNIPGNDDFVGQECRTGREKALAAARYRAVAGWWTVLLQLPVPDVRRVGRAWGISPFGWRRMMNQQTGDGQIGCSSSTEEVATLHQTRCIRVSPKSRLVPRPIPS